VQDGAASWSVVDLGSTNGTELNGRRIDSAPLADGDRITIGGTDLVFGRTVA
jgi:pSer/pThr/pTyr-binding forkhead associated (FHA) protein